MADVKSIPTADLEQELKRRKEEAAAVVFSGLLNRWAYLQVALEKGPELLSALAPEHGRTSCADDNLVNGSSTMGDRGRTAPRCNRCLLIELMRGGVVPRFIAEAGHTFSIQFGGGA